jgi:hypothetical protein
MIFPLFIVLSLFCLLLEASYIARPFEYMFWYEVYKFEFRNVPIGERLMAPGSGANLLDLKSFLKHIAKRQLVDNPKDPNGPKIPGPEVPWEPTPERLPNGIIDGYTIDDAYGRNLRGLNIPNHDIKRLIKTPSGPYVYQDWGDLMTDIGERGQDTRARVALMRPPPDVSAQVQRVVEASQLSKQGRLYDIEHHRVPDLRAVWEPKGVTIMAPSRTYNPSGFTIPEQIEFGQTISASPVLKDKQMKIEFTKAFKGGYEDLHGQEAGYPKDGHYPIYAKVEQVSNRLRKPIEKDFACSRARALMGN